MACYDGSMLYHLIEARKNAWLNDPYCPVRPLVTYMRQRGQLRDAQIGAIETYLFLKFEGQNKPLGDLLTEGFFFSPPQDGERKALNEELRRFIEKNPAAWSLYKLAQEVDEKNQPLLPNLREAIEKFPTSIDYSDIIRKIFYGVSYPDYLFSLPMGAGKTFLIAALIYLDLHFALQNPEDPKFAHNFLVLIPSGLKTSIAPSLKTIKEFDPSWVLPEPAASNIRRLLHFEVLDAPKTERKSNKVRNPNAQKVNLLISQPDPMGLVFLVNAEKVILNRLYLDEQNALIEKDQDERDHAANELRHILGKIPRLGIHIDEVHHAAHEEIKLRQVVTHWAEKGAVVSVMGYSGTPYLAKAERIPIKAKGNPYSPTPNIELRLKQITNTVYYYPLVEGIGRFLKKPMIREAANLSPQEIIRRGVQEFYENYGTKIYANGTTAKLAIYCGTIERLEEEVYPLLRDELQIPEEDILKFHQGNKRYKVPPSAASEFAALDTPASRKRIILLVQVGKEGWDCRSLTGVILAQKKDSPPNMVLQVASRCLRQVDRNATDETALIWLSRDNYKIFAKQLQTEQRIGVKELEKGSKESPEQPISRVSRADYLKLPSIEFYQLRISYEILDEENVPDPTNRLLALLKGIKEYVRHATIQKAKLVQDQSNPLVVYENEAVAEERGERLRFDQWLYLIVREGLGAVSFRDLKAHARILRQIFDAITISTEDGGRFTNELYDQERIRSRIRAAFFPHRKLHFKEQIIQENARLLLVSKLTPVSPKGAYPSEEETQIILDLDGKGISGEEYEREFREEVEKLHQKMEEIHRKFRYLPHNFHHILPLEKPAIRWKERTFHYIPYSFSQSALELQFLEACLKLPEFQQKNLEVYYNGERGLTEFVIECYKKESDGLWRRVGPYTPDFLVLQRDAKGQPYRILIVEAKGKGYEKDFEDRYAFISSTFLAINRNKFDYDRFDFFFFRENDPPEKRLAELAKKLKAFFA